MIELFSGPPGGGKSFHMIDKALATRKPVVANFGIKEPRGNFHYMETPTVAELVELSLTWPRKESQALLLLDEASRYFNSRAWQRTYQESMEWVTFFAEHRKLGYDVVLAAQSSIMLDKQVRVNIELERKHLRANRVFPFKLIPWPLFFVVTSWYAVPAMRKHMTMMIYRPWVGKRYDTYRRFHVESSLLAARQRGAGAPVGRNAAASIAKLDPEPSVTPVTSVRERMIELNRGGADAVGGEAPAAPAIHLRERSEPQAASTAGGVRLLPEEWTGVEQVLEWNKQLEELHNSQNSASIVQLPRRA
jgi:zona occludens toxin